MNGSIKRVGMAVLAVAMVASAANAAALFSENFDNLAVGDYVNGATPTTVAGTSWAAYGFARVAANPNGTGNVMHFEGKGAATRLWANFGGSHKGNMVVQYDYYVPTVAGNPETYPVVAMVDGFSGTETEVTKTAVATNSPSINMWNYKSASPGWDAISMDTMQRDQWYRIKMEIPDYSGQASGAANFNITITDLTGGQGVIVDNLSLTGLADVSDPTAVINMMRISGWADSTIANNSYYYMDNISVETIPEPMTMALLGVGGIACALRRRKRA